MEEFSNISFGIEENGTPLPGDLRGVYTEGMGMKDEKAKKQVPLRLSPSLYQELMRWADEEFRSLNGQIEYLLTACVRKRKGGSSLQSDHSGRRQK